MPGPGGHGRRPMEKGKLDFKQLFKVLSYGKKYLPLIILSTIFAALQAVASILGPDKIKGITNAIANGIAMPGGINMDDVMPTVYFMIGLYLVGAISGYLSQLLANEATQRISRVLRTRINEKINKLPLSYFDSTTTGDILSRITNDVDTISQTLGSAFANLLNALVMFIGVVIMMFVVNWQLSLITIGCSFVGFIGSSVVIGVSQKYFRRRQADLGKMNGQIEEIYSNHRIVKAFGAEEETIEKFNEVNQSLRKNNRMSQFFSGMMGPLMNFAGNFSYAMIFMIGVALALNNAGVDFGTIISFTIYARLFSSPLSTFAQSFSSFQQAGAASERVVNLLEKEEMEDESYKTKEVGEIQGAVEFRHVNFSYDSSRVIIHDFSAKVNPGMKVAIVGPTGAGKTTMVNLLMRFYETCGGDILIDGVSIKEYKREQIHDMFDMILQDTWLFGGTVRENLCFNKVGVSDETLDKVCHAAGLDHYVASLPNGYDTPLDDTTSLSEGQKQQLTIARAMVKDSKMLILDEATSSVDTRTEIKIQEAMDALTEGRTSFVIAHRLSTIKNADLILVMKDGDIIEQGTHKELLGKKGFYAELYNSQFDPE
ncbi:MAG: ABC transporter ATP-binding protein/permease [Bacilli bacterium]|nr:ABC transporter ATP-binding protein/permease [Bacilli bacterium]